MLKDELKLLNPQTGKPKDGKLIVPGSVIARRNAAINAADQLYVEMMLAVAYVYGAIEGGGTGDQLRRVIEQRWRQITGNYANMLSIAREADRELMLMLQADVGPSINNLNSAIARYLHGDGDIAVLVNMAAQFDELSAQLVGARNTINRGGTPEKPALDALYRLSYPMIDAYKNRRDKWSALAADLWRKVKNTAQRHRTADQQLLYELWRAKQDPAKRVQQLKDVHRKPLKGK